MTFSILVSSNLVFETNLDQSQRHAAKEVRQGDGGAEENEKKGNLSPTHCSRFCVCVAVTVNCLCIEYMCGIKVYRRWRGCSCYGSAFDGSESFRSEELRPAFLCARNPCIVHSSQSEYSISSSSVAFLVSLAARASTKTSSYEDSVRKFREIVNLCCKYRNSS